MEYIPIKSLLIGMLASIALVGCTNEDPIDGGNEQQEAATRGKAYISVGFSSQTNSSRAYDGCGTTDNSGHQNAGTEAENAVENVLLVIAKCNDTTPANSGNGTTNDLVTPTADGTKNGLVIELTKSDFTKNANGTYSLNEQYRFDYLGNYKVLVVINPVDDLLDGIAGMDHKEAYEYICGFSGQARTGENADGNFMMTNKKQVVVATSANNDTPEKAVTAVVDVERVISKVTYRWKEANASYPGDLGAMINVHEVSAPLVKHTAVTKSFWYKNVVPATTTTESYDQYIHDANFNQAKDINGNLYWVLLKNGATLNNGTDQITADKVVAAFTANAEGVAYTKYIGLRNGETTPYEDDFLPETYATATARITTAFVEGLTFVTTTTTDNNQKYYVHLTHYALTNLTNEVYAVRHIKSANGVRQFGDLLATELLQDPNTATKEGANFTNFTSVFTNTYQSVVDAISPVTVTSAPSPFVALPTANETGAVTDVTGGTPEYNTIGAHLRYVYENVVAPEKATANLVPGIVFVGQIYDETGAAVNIMYKYDNKFYRTLEALVRAKGTNGVLTLTTTSGETTTTHKITPNSTVAQAEAAGIDVYDGGRCYYYTADIKHYEYASTVETAQRYMEHAIMRNNIYSLAVTGIKEMGDAHLTLAGQAPIIDVRAYITLQVNILKWIVRFNDLDL